MGYTIVLMAKIRLTKKKMKDKRFYHNEIGLCRYRRRCKKSNNVTKLAKWLRIDPSTVYRHHQSFNDIIRDYEIYVLKEFKQKIKKYLKNEDITLKTIYLHTLSSISENKEMILTLFENDHKDIIKNMLDVIKERITKEWNLHGNLENIFNVYQNEVIGVIEIWAKSKFDTNEIDATLNSVMRLTETAPRRLALTIKSKEDQVGRG